MSDWQPIETAPRDGSSSIIGWNGEHVSEMIWTDEIDDDGHYGWCHAGFTYGGVLYYLHYVYEPEPTHWMPLPNPPEEPK